MVVIAGNSLGERHRDLNKKVREAADQKLDFSKVKNDEEKCDVDKLFKIDLASQYKDINYILEVLKCGDVFYITRVLKCLWLYSDEFSDYINTNYLQNNIFPHMSIRMKMKMLTNISMHVRNAHRAIDFYKFCKDSKMEELAYKFLVFTPDTFKLELTNSEENFKSFRDSKFIKQFIGKSLEIANAYMRLRNYSSYILYHMRFLYSVSAEYYLDILEKHDCCDARYPNRLQRFSLRISKSILNHHRSRVIKHPVLYINKLNKQMLIRYLTTDDVKALASHLLPKSCNYFWSIDFYHTYQFILQKVPSNELFIFIKKIFESQYPDESFEMHREFYWLKYYKMLNVEEREAWALRHIGLGAEWQDIEDYMWYRFVSFEKAFPAIKRYIFLTPDKNKRSSIVNVLPKTGRSQDDLTKILNYYYDRHVNESVLHKIYFINEVIKCHDIYSFDNACFMTLENLFYSLEVNSTKSSTDDWYTDHHSTISHTIHEYKIRTLFYYILHQLNFPETLEEYIENLNYYRIKDVLIDPLSKERNTVTSKFLLNYHAKKIESLIAEGDTTKNENEVEENEDFEHNSIRDRIDTHVYKIWNIINTFKRDQEECPKIALQYMEDNEADFQDHEIFKAKFVKNTEEDFVRWIKQDVKMALNGIEKIRCNAYRWNFRLCRLFRKLKTYFPDDVGKKYLEYFKTYLSDIPKSRREYRNIKMAVVGVFYLAEQDYKINFMEKYVPDNTKIVHRNINNNTLQVQKAICRLVYLSRPPLPVSVVLKYIKGDYIHFCLPIFNNFLVNSISIAEFIECVLNTPLSVQKHGLRLAFKSYSYEDLKPLITDVWNKTKNVSLRMLLYITLFSRIIKDEKKAQSELYEVLKKFTSELNHDDHDNVFSLLVSSEAPYEFKGDFIKTAWVTVSKLSDKTLDLERKTTVVNYMEANIDLIHRDFLRSHIINDHVQYMLSMKNIEMQYKEHCLKQFVMSKWSLTARYITSFYGKEEQQHSIELLHTIVTKCIEFWDQISDNTYIYHKFLCEFIKMIEDKDSKITERCGDMIPIYECIYNVCQISLNNEEIYLLLWKLKLSIVCRKIIHNWNNLHENTNKKNLCSEEVAKVFGKEVANMIVSSIENGDFFRCFYQSISDIISNTGSTICEILSVGDCGFNYALSDSLTEVKVTELHVVALLLLPTDPPYNWLKEHERSLEKIKQFECKEIRTLLHEKYVSSDCKVRDYLLKN